ncbi:MAG TPA: hypothetical protein VN754_06010 [Candidatus Binataceae bacterium]|nr:hypothetical protein [Candidatus Binataceae bacterium]
MKFKFIDPAAPNKQIRDRMERQFAAIHQAAVHPHLTAPQAQELSRIVALAGARA